MKRLKTILPVVIVVAVFVVISRCRNEPHKANKPPSLRPLAITIDWLPSAEYYGLFFAKQQGFYSDIGFDVQIISGNGAPSVAAQIATGASLVGTTTSDNILRQIQKGAVFSKACALIPVNLASLVVNPSSKITEIADLNGKNVGVNIQSSAYSQFTYLLKLNNVPASSITEIPIGYGGQVEFKTGKADAFCAYTSNHAVDLGLDGTQFGELLFEHLGVSSYGVVLLFADSSQIEKAGLSKNDVANLIKATIKGYDNGAKDEQAAYYALQCAEPTLKKEKVLSAIRKVGQLRSLRPAKPQDIDSWLEGQVSDETRAVGASLYEQ